MPYKMFKQGEKWCVKNSETGANKGCSASRAQGLAHMRALYAAESGAKMGTGKFDKKETDPDLDMLQHILEDPQIEDKDAAIASLSAEAIAKLNVDYIDTLTAEGEADGGPAEQKAATIEADVTDCPDCDPGPSTGSPALLQRIVNAVKAVFADAIAKPKELGDSVCAPEPEPAPEPAAMMIWKEETSGQYQWVARYSNMFRDDDNPPEIIASSSHQRFADLVDKGLAQMPELWLWHVPEWRIGQANFLAYDDTGFAIAGGVFDKGKEPIAEALMAQKDVAVSHGMPVASIKRDPHDPSIIIEHETIEISPLPSFAAANKHTGFLVLAAANSKEAEMAIPDAKRKTLIEQWHISPGQLEALEKMNLADREKATEEGRESKEAEMEHPEPVTEPEAAATDAKDTAETPVEEAVQAAAPVTEPTLTGDYPTRTEIADAFGTVLGEMQGKIDLLMSAVEGLSKELTLLKEAGEHQDHKVASLASVVPAASLASLLGQSVVGRKETSVDGRVALAQQKPKEAEPAPVTGIPFIDHMLNG